MPRPNWFFAFPIAGAFAARLPALPANFRLFHPSDVHLTLAFLGGVGEDGAARALAELDRRLVELVPRAFDISLGPVVPMGSAQKYTALSALLEQGRAEATRILRELCDPLLRAASGRTEKRAPKPHVTLARPRTRVTAEQRTAGLAWAAQCDLRSVGARLDTIALYSWDETRHERLFRIVESRKLE